MPTPQLFLSYNSRDRAAVGTARRLLETRGVTTWMDRENLPLGLPWQREAEQALAQVEAVAVFIGPHGWGPWQEREVRYALSLQVAAERNRRAFPVIPVLLGGASMPPGFLKELTGLPLAADGRDAEALNRLAQVVR